MKGKINSKGKWVLAKGKRRVGSKRCPTDNTKVGEDHTSVFDERFGRTDLQSNTRDRFRGPIYSKTTVGPSTPVDRTGSVLVIEDQHKGGPLLNRTRLHSPMFPVELRIDSQVHPSTSP